jgi:hypothetical protein
MYFRESFDPIAQLAHPVFGGLASLSCFLCFFWISKAILNRQKSLNISYRKATMLAEFLTAIGLLGLITYVGRVKLDANDHSSALTTSRAHWALYKRIPEFLAAECARTPTSQSTRADAALMNMCDFARKYERERDRFAYWDSFKRDCDYLTELFRKSNPTRAVYFEVLSKDVTKYVEARGQEQGQPLQRFEIQTSGHWIFLMICFLFACCGVSIKCAKAWLDRND